MEPRFSGLLGRIFAGWTTPCPPAAKPNCLLDTLFSLLTPSLLKSTLETHTWCDPVTSDPNHNYAHQHCLLPGRYVLICRARVLSQSLNVLFTKKKKTYSRFLHEAISLGNVLNLYSNLFVYFLHCWCWKAGMNIQMSISGGHSMQRHLPWHLSFLNKWVNRNRASTVVHTFSPSQHSEGTAWQIWGQPVLQRELRCCTVRLCSKKGRLGECGDVAQL